jgi:eukaryotic-like serine/threonine-protein kinase
MSPEQAKGKTVDKRGDIWAFGCVLFEMLSGRPVFAGDTPTEVVANVLTRQPHWDALPAGLPAPITRVIRRCLEKDPNQRLRDIGDARADIEEACSSPSTLPGVAESASARENDVLRHNRHRLVGATGR